MNFLLTVRRRGENEPLSKRTPRFAIARSASVSEEGFSIDEPTRTHFASEVGCRFRVGRALGLHPRDEVGLTSSSLTFLVAANASWRSGLMHCGGPLHPLCPAPFGSATCSPGGGVAFLADEPPSIPTPPPAFYLVTLGPPQASQGAPQALEAQAHPLPATPGPDRAPGPPFRSPGEAQAQGLPRPGSPRPGSPIRGIGGAQKGICADNKGVARKSPCPQPQATET